MTVKFPIYYIDDIICKTYSLSRLLEDLLQKRPCDWKPPSWKAVPVAAAVCRGSRAQSCLAHSGRTGLISSPADALTFDFRILCTRVSRAQQKEYDLNVIFLHICCCPPCRKERKILAISSPRFFPVVTAPVLMSHPFQGLHGKVCRLSTLEQARCCVKNSEL